MLCMVQYSYQVSKTLTTELEVTSIKGYIVREVTLPVFCFEELSEAAQAVAYKSWLEGENDCDYNWQSEFSSLLKAIKDETGVQLSNYDYSPDTNSFELDTNFGDFELDDTDICGIRAGKIALKMYHQLVDKHQLYAKYSTLILDGKEFGYLNEEYVSLANTYRRSAFIKVSEAFTGIYSSATFALTLYGSIRKNYTNDEYTVADHLDTAFSAIFDEAMREWEYQTSREYFEENRVEDFEYLEDGSVFGLSELETEA